MKIINWDLAVLLIAAMLPACGFNDDLDKNPPADHGCEFDYEIIPADCNEGAKLKGVCKTKNCGKEEITQIKGSEPNHDNSSCNHKRCDFHEIWHDKDKECPEDHEILKHTHDLSDATSLDATCYNEGYENLRKCTLAPCTHTEVDKTIPAKGCDWGEWEKSFSAGCTTEGQEMRRCKTDDKHTRNFRSTPPLGHKDMGNTNCVHDFCEQHGWSEFKKYGDGKGPLVCRAGAHPERICEEELITSNGGGCFVKSINDMKNVNEESVGSCQDHNWSCDDIRDIKFVHPLAVEKTYYEALWAAWEARSGPLHVEPDGNVLTDPQFRYYFRNLQENGFDFVKPKTYPCFNVNDRAAAKAAAMEKIKVLNEEHGPCRPGAQCDVDHTR